jgi:hypothetical protein
MPAWKVSAKKLDDACAEFGVTLPVVITFSNGNGGGHLAAMDADGEYHHITISRKLSESAANEVLWHELCHAIQCERFDRETGRGIVNQYRDEYKKGGITGRAYWENPDEKEARNFALNHGHRSLMKD